MTDNFNAPSKRETYALVGTNKLYSITNNAYYGIQPWTSEGTQNRLYWSTNTAYANTTFYGRATADGTNRIQIYLNNTAKAAPYNFCIDNSAAGGSNPSTGYHVQFYMQPYTTNCIQTNLYLSPVANG